MVSHETYWSTITDCNGAVEQELSYDAWGNLRDPETWCVDASITPMFDRGYTGHEHLNGFGLINMNGRMYDPVMSSFLSVDAYVQSPDNSQNFNRYAYCLNNPLKYTDPSGWVMVGGMTPSNPFHDTWEQNFGEKIYTSTEVRQMLWTMDISIGTWMVGNEMKGGGGGCSNSGESKGNTNTTPDDPPGSKQNTTQQLKERAKDASSIVGTDATIVEKAAKLTWFMEGGSAGLSKIIRVTSKVSTAGLVINIIIDAERAYDEEISWQSFTMRTMVNGVEYTCFKIPHVVATSIGIGLLLYDITGGFENNLYNDAWLHEHVAPYVAPIRNNLTPNYSEYGQMPIYYRHGK